MEKNTNSSPYSSSRDEMLNFLFERRFAIELDDRENQIDFSKNIQQQAIDTDRMIASRCRKVIA